MQSYCFTLRSITAAMQAQATLQRAAIRATLRRAPTSLRSNGCGYCVLVGSESFLAARSILPENSYQKIFLNTGRDTWQEVGR